MVLPLHATIGILVPGGGEPRLVHVEAGKVPQAGVA
jgi:hypothetical protein